MLSPPIVTTLPGITASPFEIFRKLSWKTPSVLLEGQPGGWFDGRFSVIGADPFAIFQSKGAVTRFEPILPGSKPSLSADGDPLQHLQKCLDRFAASPLSDTDLPFLQGGAIGFFGYDLAQQFETLPAPLKGDPTLPDIFLLFLNRFIVYDHSKQALHIIYNPTPETNLSPEISPGETDQTRRKKGVAYLEAIRRKIEAPCQSEDFDQPAPPLTIQSSLTAEDYMQMVRRAKEYIAAGDIFQANLSHRFHAQGRDASMLTLYQRLQKINPSPFSAYLDLGEIQIASSSPERLIRVRQGIAETWPIAGTKPRGRTHEEDEQMIQALCGSEKERAEHLMLVDLERNDLGKVCQPGSIQVRSLMKIERYSHLFHLVTHLQGEMRPGVSPLQGLKAMFPGGTITGVPKIRCMEIISELEKEARGIYTGAIGYLSFAGEMDLNIAIRTLVKKGDEITLQVGAGIVADSDPESEYQETLNKAAALIRALNGS